ncbi:type IV pilus biogenesis protein PilN [Vibrio astriarenae]|nr:type IV pilus biogenesis protein PilN [Vibrio sp. C7]
MNGVLVEVTGISDSTARLATMLDSLEKSPQLNNVEMHSIVHDKPRFGKKYQTFKVSFELAQGTVSVLPRFHAEEVSPHG